jgi:zinc and cadmium transporter
LHNGREVQAVNLLMAVAASILVSAISLIGVFGLLLRAQVLEKYLFLLVSLAAGGLIGGAFLHLMPEAIRNGAPIRCFSILILGFVLFFVIEKVLFWRHCHKQDCDVHPFTYLNLIGDGIHNFIDGLIIGVSFTVDIRFGAVTTLAIVLHEIPQEIGDFGILVYGGFSKGKALFYNFLSSLTAIAGTLMGYVISSDSVFFTALLLPFAAGGFVYIAACDLIPELKGQRDPKSAFTSMGSFVTGIGYMFPATAIHVQ